MSVAHHSGLPRASASLAVATPIGQMELVETDGAITALRWRGHGHGRESRLLNEAARQLTAYFEGRLTVFDLPLAPAGNSFQQDVFAAMRAIPYGQTRTYGELAADLNTYGQPVGKACGANPIPIVIPCHRVLAAEGVGGFSGFGGVEMKIALLKHEGGFPYLL